MCVCCISQAGYGNNKIMNCGILLSHNLEAIDYLCVCVSVFGQSRYFWMLPTGTTALGSGYTE